MKKGDDELLLWLVWKYEGKSMLFEFMKDKNFLYNVELYMFKDGEVSGGLSSGARRKFIIIGKILD